MKAGLDKETLIFLTGLRKLGLKKKTDTMVDRLLSEGGSGGHMLHPFNLPQVKTGKDLIEFFRTAADFVAKKKDNIVASDSSSIKFDGVNVSIKLIDGPGGKEFALDRGSTKALDIDGVTAEKLPSRFSEGHGMIKAGKIMLDIFNSALPRIESDLKALGMWDDPTKFFNAEFVWKKTNVVQYPEDFIAIHGVNQFYEKTNSRTGEYRSGLTRPVDDNGKPIKDVATETEYDENALENIKEKTRPMAQKFGFNLYTVVPTARKEDIKEIDFGPALNTSLKITFEEKSLTKTLGEWLNDKNTVNPRMRTVAISDGTRKAALSKFVYQSILGGAPLSELLVDPEDTETAINGALFYYGTQVLGSVILNSLTSPLGDLTGTDTKHEGIVLRNKKLFGSRPVKITGEFITSGDDTPFRSKPEQADPKPIQENEEDVVGPDQDNPNIRRKIAVFPGKFKPPQKGHLEAAKRILEKVDYLYIMVSPLPRSIGDKEVGVDEAKRVWELYLESAGITDKVTVITSPFNSPVQASYAVMDGDVPSFIPKPGDLIVPVASDKPDDKGNADYLRFEKYHLYQPKLEGVIPGNIVNFYIDAFEDETGSINARDFRDSLEKGEQIDRYIPDGVNPNDVRSKLGFPLAGEEPLTNPYVNNTSSTPLEELLNMVEDILLEGDWQPAAKRRTSKSHKRLIDKGRKDLVKYGAPFNVARAVDKSNAFLALEETDIEEASAAGAVQGAAGKSPFINFDEEENDKTN